MAREILGVGQVTAYLKQLVETDDLLGNCWIQGEVVQLSRPASGHLYFALADTGASLSCVMWRSSATRQRHTFKPGDSVTVHGRFAVYEPQGKYQLVADSVQPAGLGLAALEFERLRARLEAEGLFDPGRKRTIPTYPKRIGVVTSPSGAVWHDIQQVLTRRYPIAELILAPAQVQGDGAPASIAQALRLLYEFGDCDVIIVGRGGGSADDLAAFNDEKVARAVFASPVPTISAVGHETDWSLTDLVADLRAPTPSAAAELASPSRSELLETVFNVYERMERAVSQSMTFHERHIDALSHRLAQSSPILQIRHLGVAIESKQFDMTRMIALNIADKDAEVARQRDRTQRGWLEGLRRVRSELALHVAQLNEMNPRSVLDRGYALLEELESGAVLRSVRDTSMEHQAKVIMSDGYLVAEIREQHAITEQQPS